MSLKDRLSCQLKHARETSERFLEDFKKPEQWTYQVHEGANHAIWFAGHMAMADNFFISMIDASKAVEKEGYKELFGMGSKPSGKLDDYPAVEGILASMKERRGTLLEVLGGLSDEDLAKPTPEGAPDFLSDFGSVFEMAIWHEGLHAGQLSTTRRALGCDPVF